MPIRKYFSNNMPLKCVLMRLLGAISRKFLTETLATVLQEDGALYEVQGCNGKR